MFLLSEGAVAHSHLTFSTLSLSHSLSHFRPLPRPTPQIQHVHGVDQFALMDAQTEHASDPEIHALMMQLRAQIFGEEQMEEMEAVKNSAPADMTSDRFVEVMRKHMGILEGHFKKALVETAEVTKTANYDERVQYLEYL